MTLATDAVSKNYLQKKSRHLEWNCVILLLHRLISKAQSLATGLEKNIIETIFIKIHLCPKSSKIQRFIRTFSLHKMAIQKILIHCTMVIKYIFDLISDSIEVPICCLILQYIIHKYIYNKFRYFCSLHLQ